jgi:hypothetical protein
MEIEQSSLYREIKAVINGDAKPVHFYWSAKIHVNNEVLEPLKVLSIDIIRDYENNYGEEILITMAVLGGKYAKRIYPYKGKIDISLEKLPLYETGVETDKSKSVETERYTATLIDKGNPLIEGNSGNVPTEETLDLTNIFEISFQLVNKALEQLRFISIGGNYRDVLVEDVLKGVLTTESGKLDVDTARAIKGVDMVPSANKKPREHVIIPQGTMLVDLPEYLQTKCGGIYSAGLGYFLQDDYWYVYPCYDTTRFNDSTSTMTVINVPPNKFPNIERTYRADGKNIVVLATGDVKFADDSEIQQLNAGNGVRFANADKMMDGFSTTKDNKTTLSRGSNNNEFISTPREGGNNNVKLSSARIQSNFLIETSKLARRQGSLMSFKWENSQNSLLYPGMMIKIMYLDHDVIKEAYGVLLKEHTYVSTRLPGFTDRRHVSNTVLTAFIGRIREVKEVVSDSFLDKAGNSVAVVKPKDPEIQSLSSVKEILSGSKDYVTNAMSVAKSAGDIINSVTGALSAVSAIRGQASGITKTLQAGYQANGWGKPGGK